MSFKLQNFLNNKDFKVIFTPSQLSNTLVSCDWLEEEFFLIK